MSERLVSVGLDVGTSTTQMILSELLVENRASAFAVPELEIVDRKILYKSPVLETPLVENRRIDADKLRRMVEVEYEAAGLERSRVQTGAVIVTGETSRKENARAAARALSELAGDFVVTTAGPDLESILAARGSGAATLSAQISGPVVHVDIGGGTSNLALLCDGRVQATGCMNVGGRLIKWDAHRRITYVSPELAGLTSLKAGDEAREDALEETAAMLTRGLEMAMGRRERDGLYTRLFTRECTGTWPEIPADALLSFSGGVAACMEAPGDLWEFGDLGPRLARHIRRSRLCSGRFRLGRETIRATVIGAGCHSAQLSGSTVYHQNVTFPRKDLPAVSLTLGDLALPPEALTALVQSRLAVLGGEAVVALPGFQPPDYAGIRALGAALAGAMPEGALVTVERDMAKALGQAMALALGPEKPCLCLDRIRLKEGDYLDVGAPVGPAVPIVVKTLIFNTQ